jgi:hypothetical protein
MGGVRQRRGRFSYVLRQSILAVSRHRCGKGGDQKIKGRLKRVSFVTRTFDIGEWAYIGLSHERAPIWYRMTCARCAWMHLHIEVH